MADQPADTRASVEKNALEGLYASTLHDINQTRAILRQATAKGHGVDPAAFAAPFPGSTTTNNTTTSGIGLPGIIAIIVGLLGSGGIGAFLAGQLAKPVVQAVAPIVAPPNPAIPFDPNAYQFRVVPDDT